MEDKTWRIESLQSAATLHISIEDRELIFLAYGGEGGAVEVTLRDPIGDGEKVMIRRLREACDAIKGFIEKMGIDS